MGPSLKPGEQNFLIRYFFTLLLCFGISGRVAVWAQVDCAAPSLRDAWLNEGLRDVLLTPVSFQTETFPAESGRTEPPDTDTVTLRADMQSKVGSTYRLLGRVEITYGPMTIHADEIVYDVMTGEVEARGNVRFHDPQADLKAEEIRYQIHSARGWFRNADGFIRAKPRPGKFRLTAEQPFHVKARRVERIDEDTYAVFGARVTSCDPKRFGWSFGATSARVKPGRRVTMRNPLFRIGALPIFYFPYLATSIASRPRKSGFLMPQFGTSSQKGVILGEGFYWAINRSADLTLGVQNYSTRGLGYNASFRARPGPRSKVNVEYFRVDDKGTGPERQNRAPGQSLRVTGESSDFFRGFRAVADVDYISSLTFRFTFTDNFHQAVRSEVRSVGFVTKSFGPYSFNAFLSRYQNFLSAELLPDNSVTIRKLPSFSFSGMERKVGKSPFYFSFDSGVSAVDRVEPGFETPALVNRTDFAPQLSLRTKSLGGFHLTPRFGVRATRYGVSRRADLSGLTRLLGEFSLDLRPPALAKVFGGTWRGYRFKHVIEPQIRYRLVRARDRAVINDIVRFDQLDILAETNEIEYSMVHRLYIRRAGNGKKSQARELISWRLSQKYFFDPTFGQALRPRDLVVFEPTNSLTGFAFATGRRLSPIISVLKFAPFSNFDTEMRADINPSGGGVMNAGITSIIRSGSWFLSVTDFFVNKSAVLATRLIAPEDLPKVSSFHLLRGVVGLGDVSRRGLSATLGSDFNFSTRVAHQSFGLLTYNFGCFAVDAEFRRFSFGSLRRENQFRVTLSLSNVGSFGNLRVQRQRY